jgi:hypothetical protein
MHRLAALSLVLLACSGDEPAKTAAAPASAATPAAQPVVQTTNNTAGETPAPPRLVSGGEAPTGGDPAWFRKELFPGATVASSGRTAKDADGLWQSQMLLALADGTTQATCVDALRAALSGAVPELKEQTGKDGRVTLSGSNADYSVTLICGNGKDGKPSAYVSYRWLRAPGG